MKGTAPNQRCGAIMTMYHHSFPTPVAAYTASDAPTVIEALRLYHAGLNVFPTPHGSKEPFGEHAFLNASRLYEPLLAEMVADCNIAVMMGRLSGGLFVLDCDSEADYQRIGRELDARSIGAWVRNSTRGGQFWLRCKEGEVANGKYGDTQFLGNRTYSMAPPSVHPTGMVYEWISQVGGLPPLVTLDLLDFLPLRLQRRTTSAQEKNGLPSVANQVLVERDLTRYGWDNSRAENAAVISLLSAGYTDGEVVDFFRMFPPPHFLRRGEEHFLRYTLKYARDFLHEAKRSEASAGFRQATYQHSAEFVGWAEAHAWPGRTGNTDKAVYLALCQRMRMESGNPFRATLREVSELAGVHKETVAGAIRRLKGSGYVRQVASDRATDACRFSLLPPDAHGQGEDEIRPVGSPTPSFGSNGRVTNTRYDMAGAAHDAWCVKALGKSTFFCWRALLAEPGMTVADVMAQTGRGRPTVKRALARLELHRLAHATDAGWVGVEATREMLDVIACQYGTLGRADKRRDLHQDERQKHASVRLMEQKRRWQEAHQR